MKKFIINQSKWAVLTLMHPKRKLCPTNLLPSASHTPNPPNSPQRKPILPHKIRKTNKISIPLCTSSSSKLDSSMQSVPISKILP